MPSVPTSGSVPPPPPVWDARPPETAVHYAGFWIRVVAAIVDGIALWIVWSLIVMVLPTDAAAPLPENPDLVYSNALYAFAGSLKMFGPPGAFFVIFTSGFSPGFSVAVPVAK